MRRSPGLLPTAARTERPDPRGAAAEAASADSPEPRSEPDPRGVGTFELAAELGAVLSRWLTSRREASADGALNTALSSSSRAEGGGRLAAPARASVAAPARASESALTERSGRRSADGEAHALRQRAQQQQSHARSRHVTLASARGAERHAMTHVSQPSCARDPLERDQQR